jgi:hypothetical protein
VIEVWRRHLTAEPVAAVRVLAKSEAGTAGPDEYAVGITTRPDAQLYPEGDTGELFTGLSYAEAHWVAAVLASVAENTEDAENLLFDLRVPVELTWRDVELSAEVVEPGGLRSSALVPWQPEGSPQDNATYAVAIYTFECGHQAVELLRQDPESAPFWVLEGAVDHVAARDARSLSRLLMGAATLDEAHDLIEQAQENLATHASDHEHDHDDDDDDDDHHDHDH